jgi:transposase
MALLEGLQPRDRGFVVARLKAVYDKKTPKGSSKPKPANAEWKATPEYKEWKEREALVKREGKTLPVDDPKVVALSQARLQAFQVHSRIKAQKSGEARSASSIMSAKQTSSDSSSLSTERKDDGNET